MSTGKVIPLDRSRANRGRFDQYSDDELMLLTRGGKPEAFGELVRRHQMLALNLAHKYLFDASLAEDASQNAFAELFGYAARYDAQGKLKSLLCRLVINHCRMLGRKAQRRRRREELAPTYESRDLPDDEVLANERRRNLQRAVAQLSDKLRAPIVLRYTQDLECAEIAAILGIPEGTVKSRLSRAGKQLQKHLPPEGT